MQIGLNGLKPLAAVTFLAACATSAPMASTQELRAPGGEAFLEINYEGFTVWIDCERRSAVTFHYVADVDTGNEPRHSSYDIDPNVDRDCQTFSTDTFQSVLPEGAPSYDVGHQAPANHFDGSAEAIRETNFWTNLLPQTASMNRGAWLETEFIIECLRDETPVEVWGGPVWAGHAPDEYFRESHGMETPSAYWKIAIRTDTREAQAWLIPNGPAPARSLDQWLQPVSTIEALTRLEFDVADRELRPASSWAYDRDCIS